MAVLTGTQIAQFHDLGYVLIERALPASDLQPLIHEFEEAVDRTARRCFEAGTLRALYADASFERRLALLAGATDDLSPILTAFEGKAHKTAGMFALMTHPVLLDIVEGLIGPEILAHPQFNVRAKLPGDPYRVVPWHQDLAYLEPEAADTRMVNFWIPFIDAPMETGALQVIPGSHRWGLIPHESLNPTYIGVADASLPPHEVVGCPLPLGGVLIMQHRLMHRSIENTTPFVRWSADIRCSDPAQPTGRPSVPGFLARSVSRPGAVAHSYHDWLALFEPASA